MPPPFRSPNRATISLTCCCPSALSNPVTQGGYDKRIDLVLVRDQAHRGRSDRPDLFADAQVAVVGEEPSERLPRAGGDLWLSAHAGVVATLRLP
jgi:hypothetical protein